jgi:hypothetical protein
MNILETRIRNLLPICTDLTRVSECNTQVQFIASLLNLSKPIVGTISQYSPEFNGHGISACTTMAIFTSIELLKILNSNNFTYINTEFIDSNIRKSYQLFTSKTKEDRRVFHQDINMVKTAHSLDKFYKGEQDGTLSTLTDLNDIINNVFTNTIRNYNFMDQSFNSVDITRYAALLIVKPPETISILLPPPNSNLPFLLFDSHSRPPTFKGSYIICFYSKIDLINYLTTNLLHNDATGDEFEAHAFQN